MIIKSPKSKKLFLTQGITLYLFIPIVVCINTYINLTLGMYPPNADSIAIPIFQSSFLTIIFSPVMALYLYLAVRNYKANVKIFSWKNSKRYILSLIFTTPFFILSILFIYIWIDTKHYIMAIHWLFIANYILLMRVALSEKNLA